MGSLIKGELDAGDEEWRFSAKLLLPATFPGRVSYFDPEDKGLWEPEGTELELYRSNEVPMKGANVNFLMGESAEGEANADSSTSRHWSKLSGHFSSGEC